MAKEKRKSVVCPRQAACDGAEMQQGREMCAKCAKKLRRQEEGYRPMNQPGISKLAGAPEVT